MIQHLSHAAFVLSQKAQYTKGNLPHKLAILLF